MAAVRLVAGRYALARLLGRGGMGEVYEAIDNETGQRLAVKIMRSVASRPEDDPEDERQWRLRFEREIRTIRSVASPHVVQVIASGVDDATNTPFLAMELLDGEDLAKLTSRLGPMPIGLALRLTAQAALGLAGAHARGIIHRDIKLGNIFLTRVGARREVRILDFGIARSMGREQPLDFTELTQTGTMLGSPTYMSPEQVRASKTVDARADVWSLGVVLYRLLTGTVPHEATDGSFGDLLIAICCTPAPNVQERAPWVPSGVAAIIDRALRIARDERFASAEEMYEALVAQIPGGSTDIDDTMLVQLSEAERAPVSVAPPASATIALAVRPAQPESRTHDPVSSAVFREPLPQRASRLGLGLAALGALALAGAIAVTGLRTAKVADAAASAQRAEPLAPPPPPVELAAPVQIAAPLSVPRSARVEVDGEAVEERDGFVTLRGIPGDRRTVRVVLDEREAAAIVAITPGGAVPASIALPRASAAAPSPVARPAKAATPRAAAAPTSRPTPSAAAAPGLRTDFE